MYLYVPPSVKGDRNTTIMLNIQKKSMEAVKDQMTFVYFADLHADLTHWSKNITAPNPRRYYDIYLDREVPTNDIENMDLDMMPGFRLTWKYDKDVEPEPIFSNQEKTKQFNRLVNIFAMTKLDLESFWNIVREIRKSFLSENTNPDCDSDNILLSDTIINDNINTVEEKLKLNTTLPQNESLSDDTLQIGFQMFTYLNYCPATLFNFIRDIKESATPKDILLALTSIEKSSQNAIQRSSAKIFTKAMEVFKLNHYKNINTIAIEEGFHDCTMDNVVDSCKETIEILG